MRIDLYKLHKNPEDFDLASLLNSIMAEDLDKRNRQRERNYIRLEHAEAHKDVWLCDFVKLRMDHGPARAGLHAKVKGFDLDDDEGFGEETAMLWDMRTNYCVVQYNHHGVRPKAMIDYLSLYSHDSSVLMQLLPKLDDEIQSKLRKKKVVTRFELGIAPKLLTKEDFENGMSLGEAAAKLRTTGADRINIELVARSGEGHDLEISLAAMAKWISSFGHKPKDEADSKQSKDAPILMARATAKEQTGDPAEVLDLLGHTVTSDANLTPGVDKRYSQKERFAALMHARNQWKALTSDEQKA